MHMKERENDCCAYDDNDVDDDEEWWLWGGGEVNERLIFLLVFPNEMHAST